MDWHAVNQSINQSRYDECDSLTSRRKINIGWHAVKNQLVNQNDFKTMSNYEQIVSFMKQNRDWMVKIERILCFSQWSI